MNFLTLRSLRTLRFDKLMGPTTASFSSISPKKIRVIGIPLDLGQSRRGVDMGPSAVRVAGLEARLEALGHVVEDGGNVAVAIPEQKKEGDPHAKYLKEITATCTKHAEQVLKTLEAGKVPVVLGGDHSVAAGTVAGVAEFYRRQNQKIGLIWIDAHADINTPDSSPSGNVHGMPLAAIMGLGPPELANIFNFSPKVNPENCVLVGVRDIDATEKENIRKAGIEVFTMRDIDERGMRTIIEEALRMAGRGTADYHVSLDMHSVDPEDAPGFSSTFLADGGTLHFDENDFGNRRVALCCGYQRNQSCLQGGEARIIRSVLDVRPFICVPKSSSDCHSRISLRIRCV